MAALLPTDSEKIFAETAYFSAACVIVSFDGLQVLGAVHACAPQWAAPS